MTEKNWVWYETRTKNKETNQYYKIKIDNEDLKLLESAVLYVYISKNNKLGTIVIHKSIYKDKIQPETAVVLSRLILGLEKEDNLIRNRKGSRKLYVLYINNDPLDLRKENLQIISASVYRGRNKRD